VILLIVGVVNVVLLAPVWMQMLHLLLADLSWIVLVLLAASATGVRVLVRAEDAATVPRAVYERL
jgi:cytochrome c oxidase assembly protein subunit 15